MMICKIKSTCTVTRDGTAIICQFDSIKEMMEHESRYPRLEELPNSDDEDEEDEGNQEKGMKEKGKKEKKIKKNKKKTH